MRRWPSPSQGSSEQPQRRLLPGRDHRREHRPVALVVEIAAAVERLPEDPAAIAALQPVQQGAERAAAGGLALVRPGQGDAVVGLGAEAVGRPGQVEVEAQAAPLHVRDPVRRRLLPGQAVGQHRQLAAEAGDVDDVERPGDAGGDDAVIDRLAVMRGARPAMPGQGADDGAGIAGVAVGVPAAHGRDLDRARQVALAVQQGQDQQRRHSG